MTKIRLPEDLATWDAIEILQTAVDAVRDTDPIAYAHLIGALGCLEFPSGQVCDYCGEPAGEGGSLCPACVANHQVKL